MKSHNSLSWPVIFLSILQCISGTKDAGILKKCSKVAETLKNLNTSMVLEPKNLKDLEKWNKALLDDDCQACAKNIETSVANMCCQTGNSSSCFIVKSEESEKSLNLGPLFEHCKVDGKTNAKGCQVAQQRNKEDLNNAEKNGEREAVSGWTFEGAFGMLLLTVAAIVFLLYFLKSKITSVDNCSILTGNFFRSLLYGKTDTVRYSQVMNEDIGLDDDDDEDDEFDTDLPPIKL
ncbi:uncharacterized protein LOC142351458 isoform X1 [Convolutriloba macropyga]|uniref:uncharacterized protein LOC142351458 isoform X1 n=1 Tax=Convolutriloba macropyga TaxID=536237 RepID=UPI003F52456A